MNPTGSQIGKMIAFQINTLDYLFMRYRSMTVDLLSESEIKQVVSALLKVFGVNHD